MIKNENWVLIIYIINISEISKYVNKYINKQSINGYKSFNLIYQ